LDTPLPLDRLVKDRYKISRILGQGGQCFVYEVDDIKEKRKVVLKELRSNIANPVTYKEDVDMFKKEYEILNRLDHPRLPQSYDYFKEGEDHFIVVQYVEGQNLDVLFKERNEPYEEVQVVDWGIQLAELLVYLYEIKPDPVVVRDIKPSNIMISDKGEAFLVDFTVARENKASGKGDTVRIGSPGYAPPEQYKGFSDTRSDIYALGVTLYRLLTGINPSQIPFQFEPLRHHNPDFSRKLEYVLFKALQLDPEERYQTPYELVKHLTYVKDELAGTEHPEFEVPDILESSSDKTDALPESKEEKDFPFPYMKVFAVFLGIILVILAVLFYKPFMVNYNISQGKRLFESGDFAEAERSFLSVIKLDPHNSEAGCYMAVMLFYEGDTAGAEEYLTKYCSDLNVMRERALYHYNIAKELKEKDPEKAREEYEAAEFISRKAKDTLEFPEKLFD